jgi:predicted nucleic acid-binding protein
MVKALFDTNILIDYLGGVEAARQELGRYSKKAISIVSWMEVMVGTPAELEAPTRSFLDSFERLPLEQFVAEESVRLRREYGMKLPDAIIWASARRGQWLLVTRNRKDFPPDDPSVRIPYTL